MCNACGFHCCALDASSGCGCAHCRHPLCTIDEEDAADASAADEAFTDYKANGGVTLEAIRAEFDPVTLSTMRQYEEGLIDVYGGDVGVLLTVRREPFAQREMRSVELTRADAITVGKALLTAAGYAESREKKIEAMARAYCKHAQLDPDQVEVREKLVCTATGEFELDKSESPPLWMRVSVAMGSVLDALEHA